MCDGVFPVDYTWDVYEEISSQHYLVTKSCVHLDAPCANLMNCWAL